MSFNMQQVIPYVPVMIVFILLYMVIYKKKGKNKNFMGYKDAFEHSIGYIILSIFIIVGYQIAKIGIEQSKYIALLIPVVWLLIIYTIIKKFLKDDFGIDISISKIDSVKAKRIEKMGIVLILTILFAGATIMVGIVAFDKGNKLTDIIPLLLATIVLALTTFFLANIFRLQLSGTGPKFSVKSVFYIFNLLFVLFGILFISTPVCEYIELLQLEKTTLSVQGKYIGYKIDESRSSDDRRYFCYYEYEVEGQKYMVYNSKTSIPQLGEERKILYDTNSPDKATVFEGLNVVSIIMGLAFIIIPTCFFRGMVKDIKE